MPTILLVDDTDLDRQVAAHLLAELADATLLTAFNGREALAVLAAQPVDLVLSDVQMPEMSGLELLGHIRNDFPQVPVVVVTSFGSEMLAVQALREGAASYIPKSDLQRDLVRTAESVLESAARARKHSQLLSCLTFQQQTFEIPNDSGLVPLVVGALQEGLARFDLCDERDRVRVGVAVEEALVNALVHGNLEVSSELRERFDDSFSQLVEARKRAQPYRDRKILVTMRLDRCEATIQIRDQGPGFDISKLPDPTDPENLLKCSGRGILLMRSFFDDVIYNDVGNQVTMVKRSTSVVPVEAEATTDAAEPEPGACTPKPHHRIVATVAT